MSPRIVTVDSFTAVPFAGNPAAVCLLTAPVNDRWMQDVAREMNLSETAFLVPRADGYDLRWFTPTIEVDLCGHATLASAHVLWEEGLLPATATARFHTKSGLLTAVRRGDWIEMDFPAESPSPAEAPADLLAALGVTAQAVLRNRLDVFVVVADAAVVRGLAPDLARLARVPTRGVAVTARGDGEYDFVSRFFAPAAGVPEDPVTGSSHCGLAPYWAKALGRAALTGYQASARGGVVRVRHNGDRVVLGGQAVTVVRGEMVRSA